MFIGYVCMCSGPADGPECLALRFTATVENGPSDPPVQKTSIPFLWTSCRWSCVACAAWHQQPACPRKECYYCILHSGRQQGVSPIFPCNMCEIRSCHQAFLSAPRQLSSSSPVSVCDSLPTPTTAPLQEKIAAIRQIASDVVSPHQNPVFHCQIVQPELYLWLCLTVKSPK